MVAMALTAAATLGSAAIASSAAGKSSKAQTAGADASLALQREQFEQAQENMQPTLDAGNRAREAYLFEMGLGERPVFRDETPNMLVDPTTLSVTENVPSSPYGVPDENSNDFMREQYAKAQAQPTTYTVGDETFGSNAEAQNFLAQQYQDFNAQATAAPTGGIEYGGYKATPGYDFRVSEGEKAIERSAAARGGLNSGRTLKALSQFGQNIAADDYGTFMNRLGALSGTGQTATNNLAQLGQNFAANGSNALMAAGQAKASGYANQGNIMGNAMGQLASAGGNFLGQRSAGGGGGVPQMMPGYTAPSGGYGFGQDFAF